jgi:hypothetical protein
MAGEAARHAETKSVKISFFILFVLLFEAFCKIGRGLVPSHGLRPADKYAHGWANDQPNLRLVPQRQRRRKCLRALPFLRVSKLRQSLAVQ